MNMKRSIVATLSGLLFGFVCVGFASSGGNLPQPIFWQILTSRTLIGFAIGISVLRLHHWSIHGSVMGALFSLPMAFSGLMADIPDFSKTSMFAWTVVLGMIYGILIEVITSVIFKARMEKL